MNTAIIEGSRVILTKGCKALELNKGVTARVISVTEGERRCAKVVLEPVNGYKAGKRFVLWATHMNRLSDSTVRVNTGNPFNNIEFRRA